MQFYSICIFTAHLSPISDSSHCTERERERELKRLRVTFGKTFNWNNLNHSPSPVTVCQQGEGKCSFQPLRFLCHESQNDYNNLMTSISLQSDGDPSHGWSFTSVAIQELQSGRWFGIPRGPIPGFESSYLGSPAELQLMSRTQTICAAMSAKTPARAGNNVQLFLLNFPWASLSQTDIFPSTIIQAWFASETCIVEPNFGLFNNNLFDY